MCLLSVFFFFNNEETFATFRDGQIMFPFLERFREKGRTYREVNIVYFMGFGNLNNLTFYNKKTER